MGCFDLVMFDCDGVVVDSEVLSCQCLVEVLSRYDLRIELDDVFQRFLGRSFAAVEEYYLDQRGCPLPADFRDALGRDVDATFRASLKPMPHIFEAIGGLDCPFCLASSSGMARIRLALSVTGLAELFGDRVFSAAMVKQSKPAPDLFLFAAERMAARPDRTVVVEDSVAGVLAGKAAGMTVLGFTGGSHCLGKDAGRRLTEAGADRILSSMTEFSVQ